MEVFKVNGERFLKNRRPMILGISPGNPHYFKLESLQRLFDFANENSDKVFLFISDKISEHNYRAIRSKKPEKKARANSKRLRDKCKIAIQNSDLRHAAHSFIRWEEEVESCAQYNKALADITGLYEANNEFTTDVRKLTEEALRSLGESNHGNEVEKNMVDIEEGVLYLLKELAFVVSVPSIYKNCEEFVYVYHRPWPLLERFCRGFYDGIEKQSVGYFVFE